MHIANCIGPQRGVPALDHVAEWSGKPLLSTRRLQADMRKVKGEQRQKIFTVEDKIEAHSDSLIKSSEKRLHRANRT